MKKIAIIDYGAGNTASLINAIEYLNFEQSFFDFLETNLLSLKSFYRLFFNDVKITNFVFDEFFLLDKKIIDLRLDCLNCFVK